MERDAAHVPKRKFEKSVVPNRERFGKRESAPDPANPSLRMEIGLTGELAVWEVSGCKIALEGVECASAERDREAPPQGRRIARRITMIASTHPHPTAFDGQRNRGRQDGTGGCGSRKIRDSLRCGVHKNGALARVYVAAENRWLQEELASLLKKSTPIALVGVNSLAALEAETLLRERVEILLLLSCGNLAEDLRVVQRVHCAAPGVRILLLGSAKEDGEFLQCVRAGISGYLRRDATAEDVLVGIRALRAGEAVCPAAFAPHSSAISSAKSQLCRAEAPASDWA